MCSEAYSSTAIQLQLTALINNWFYYQIFKRQIPLLNMSFSNVITCSIRASDYQRQKYRVSLLVIISKRKKGYLWRVSHLNSTWLTISVSTKRYVKGCPTVPSNSSVELLGLSNYGNIFKFIAKSFQGISFLLKRGYVGFLFVCVLVVFGIFWFVLVLFWI